MRLGVAAARNHFQLTVLPLQLPQKHHIHIHSPEIIFQDPDPKPLLHQPGRVFFEEGRLSRAQKARNQIDFYHTLTDLRILIDLRAEGHQGQLRQLEMLQAKGNPYDGHAQRRAKRRMLHRQRKARKNQPEQIQEEGACPASAAYFFSKGKEAQSRQLKALGPHRDPHNRDAPEAARQAPA